MSVSRATMMPLVTMDDTDAECDEPTDTPSKCLGEDNYFVFIVLFICKEEVFEGDCGRVSPQYSYTVAVFCPFCWNKHQSMLSLA